MLVTIGQESDFERLEEVSMCSIAQHRRDDDQGSRFRGNALGEVHSRQRMRCHQHVSQASSPARPPVDSYRVAKEADQRE